MKTKRWKEDEEPQQGLEEMKRAQKRLQEAKKSEELPLEDGKVEGKVGGEERQEIEDDPKRSSGVNETLMVSPL